MQTADVEKLYTTYAGDIYRYSIFKLHNKADAEDVVAEVFTRFMESNGDKKIENMKLWLLGFARNIIYSKHQKEKKLADIDVDMWLQNAPDEETLNTDEVVSEETVADVQAAMRTLEPYEQEIVTLKIWEELKFSEIAKLLNQNENTVKAIYYRSLDKMKHKLEKNYKQLNVITLPLLVAAIAKLKLGIALPATLSNLVNFKNMDTMQAGPEVPTQASTSSLKALLETTKGKIIAGVVAAALVTGAAGTGVYLSSQSDDGNANTPTVIPAVNETVMPTDATTDPYAGWNTYNNEAFGISVRYPDSFVLLENDTTNGSSSDQYFALKSIAQGVNSQLYGLEFRRQALLDPTFALVRTEEDDFVVNINNKNIEFAGYEYGDGGPTGEAEQYGIDMELTAIGYYASDIQLIQQQRVSTLYEKYQGSVLNLSQPSDEELRLGKLILQSIRPLVEEEGLITYTNVHLGITMQVPASWKLEDTYTPAVPPTQGSGAGVKISDANGVEIANIYSYIGGFGWCDEYEGTGNPNIKLSFTKEELIIAGKTEVFEGCYYNDVYAESLIIVDNDSINEWEGYYLEVTKAGEPELDDIKTALSSITY